MSLDPLQAKYPELSPFNFTANNPIIFIDPDGRWINWFASKGVRDYKKALMQTGEGRLTWTNLKQSKNEIVIQVTNSVLVMEDANGNLNVLAGVTINPGGNTEKAVVNVSKGTYELKAKIEASTGKKFEDLTAAEKNEAIRNELNTGSYKVENVNKETGKKEAVECEDFNRVGVNTSWHPDKPTPLDNESQAEYMNRIAVHESGHALYNNNPNYRAGMSIEDRLEIAPYKMEFKTIKEQKNDRQEKK